MIQSCGVKLSGLSLHCLNFVPSKMALKAWRMVVTIVLWITKSKWVWSGNATIIYYRPTHGTARISQTTLTATWHSEHNKSKAAITLFPSERIAKECKVFASKGYPFKNIFDFTTTGDWDAVAAVERLPVLHYSVDFIFLSFGIMGFIVELWNY